MLLHQGMGDQIICCGLVRAYAKIQDAITLICKIADYESVVAMYSDVKNIKVLPVRDEGEARSFAAACEGEVLKLGLFGNDPFDINNWDREFYRQAGVDFEARWNDFQPMTFFRLRPAYESPFQFLHDDASRGFELDQRRFPQYDRQFKPSKEFSKNILDYLPTIHGASQIHVIDSCFLCLADTVPTTGRLVFHKYARPGGRQPTLKKNWEILT